MTKLLDQVLSASKDDLSKLILESGSLEIHDFFSEADNSLKSFVILNIENVALTRILNAVDYHDIQIFLENSSDDVFAKVIERLPEKFLKGFIGKADDDFIERFLNISSFKKQKINILNSLPLNKKKKWIEILRASEDQLRELKWKSDENTSVLIEEKKKWLDELEKSLLERKLSLESLEIEEKKRRLQHEKTIKENEEQLRSMQQKIYSQDIQLKEREEQLAQRTAEFEEATKKQVQQRIELKVPEYVAAAVKVLEDRETSYKEKSKNWALLGTIVLSIAILLAILFSFYGYFFGEKISSVPWQNLLFISFKGLIIIGVLGLWAKHAFTVSNAYMHESIKRADRAHAINFGKLYLEVYGNSVERKELLDIFENWNITSDSAFLKASPDGFEPKILDKFTEVLKLMDRNKKD